jgi:hypothetical protein
MVNNLAFLPPCKLIAAFNPPCENGNEEISMRPFEKIHGLYQKHERWVPVVFFLLGFLFDVAMLRRIDEIKVILQQAVYLFVAAVLIGVDLVEETHKVEVPTWILKIWNYREAVLHFLLGTLLNSYAIFYFKSASAITSFLFIGILVLLLTLNEFKRFGESQTKVHVAFLSLCIISYFVSLAPIVLGFIGMLPFLCAVAASLAVFYAYFSAMRLKLGNESELLRTHIVQPFALVQGVFVLLYVLHLIPPVPLSVKYMGIFHGIEKREGEYALIYSRPEWKFWQHGDQTFQARPGDTIYAYAQIFSPTRFKDQLQVRWLYKDPKHGWMPSDAIPLDVLGGREQGYRVVTKKSNYQPGEWRVRIETMENVEIGRIDFEVETDDSTGVRESHETMR